MKLIPYIIGLSLITLISCGGDAPDSAENVVKLCDCLDVDTFESEEEEKTCKEIEENFKSKFYDADEATQEAMMKKMEDCDS